MIAKLLNWIKKNPKEFMALIVLLSVGAFLRLYRISEYMTFLGDEGRDVIIVRRLLVYGDPILIGPGTSIGNMYLGPLYYYMMAPALFIARFSPVGPAVQIALLGVVTIFFVWYAAREWFGRFAAWVSAILYAISPTVIIYSRSSWNPNIMPFFALLSIYSAWRIWAKEEFKWLIVLGVSYAFVLQSHYLGLLLAPTLVVFWFLTLRNLTKSITPSIGNFTKYSLLGLGVFTVLMSPLVIFDARHGWRNFGAMRQFFTERESAVSINFFKAVSNSYPIFEKVNTSLITAKMENVGKFTSALIVLGFILAFSTTLLKGGIRNKSPYLLLLTWLGFSLIGLSFYKKEVYDHYLGFLFPLPFLLISALGSKIEVSRKLLPMFLFTSSVLILIALSVLNSPIKHNPTFQLQRSQAVSKVIMEKAGKERFNIATISERNNRDVYQYFLELWGAPIVDTDPQRVEFTVTDQLFVVCEKPRADCDPIHDPSAWIANFGWTKIDSEWDVWGGTLFKLVHTK